MLAENFPNLEQLYGQGALSGYLGGQQIDAARKSQRINQDAALQEMYWKEQTNPVDIGYKQALTGQSQEATRGARFKNDMNDRTQEEQYKQEITKLSREVSEDELKRARAQIEALMLDPTTKAQGEMLFGHFSEIMRERQRAQQEHANRMELEGLKGTNAANTAQIRAKARTGTASALEKALVGSNPLQVAAAYDRMAQQAEEEDDRMFYARKAQEYRQLAIDQDARRVATGAPGQVNRGEMGIPVVPPSPPAQPPVQRGGAASAPAGGDPYAAWTMSQWKERYPGISDAKLREALKAKGYNPK
jgi:hypothetical protein